jgi:sarcosine oxidase subunit gamma
MPQPSARPLRRSFVARRIETAEARLRPKGSGALGVAGSGSASISPAQLAMCDLSPLPRIGFKGRGTIAAMQGSGVAVETKPNRAFRQPDGGLCLVLAPGEVMILSGLSGDDALVQRLRTGWSIDDPADTYFVPRASTHAWFRVTGALAPACFAKICGVDLRPHRFPDLSIAQTSVAKLTGIVVRDDLGGALGFHLLADSASAVYLWDCLVDAMAEFGGGPAEVAALAALR